MQQWKDIKNYIYVNIYIKLLIKLILFYGIQNKSGHLKCGDSSNKINVKNIFI